MKHTTAMFYQLIGWLKGFLSALLLPLTALLWFFGIIGFLSCAGISADKDEEDLTDAMAKVIERGYNRFKSFK